MKIQSIFYVILVIIVTLLCLPPPPPPVPVPLPLLPPSPNLKRFNHGGGDRHRGRVRSGSVWCCPRQPTSPGFSSLLLLLLLLSLLVLLPRRPRPDGAHRASCANAQPRCQALQHSHPACNHNNNNNMNRMKPLFILVNNYLDTSQSHKISVNLSSIICSN